MKTSESQRTKRNCKYILTALGMGVLLAALPSQAQPVVGQIVPVAVYHDLDHPFGIGYDSAHCLIWYTRGDSGDNLVHSLKPFRCFSAAEVAAMPDIGGIKQVSPALAQNDVAGTTVAPQGAHFKSLAYDSGSGQLVAQGAGNNLQSFDPFTGANANLNYRPGTANNSFTDGLDVDSGNVWFSPDAGDIFKNGVLFATSGNASQNLTGKPGVTQVQQFGWSGCEQVGNSVFAVAVFNNADTGRSRTIVKFDANTGALTGYDPDGDPVAARWEDLGYDGRYLYAADLRGNANGNNVVGDIYVFDLTGGLAFTPCTPTCPGDIAVSSDAATCGAVVFYPTPSLTGDCSNSVLTCVPPAGSLFPIGTTVVTCTVVAIEGETNTCCANGVVLTNSCSFSVTVIDNTPPSIKCPNDIVACNDAGQCSAAVNFTVTANDNCSGALTAVCNPPGGSTFPKGVTSVTCCASDAAGNTSCCTFHVTVNDCEPPQVACRPGPNPSGKKIPVAGKNPNSGQNPDGFYQLLAKDNCDASPAIYVADSCSSFIAGPFKSGDVVKLTQSPGNASADIPGPQGIAAHIHTKCDPLIIGVDASGNVSVGISCLVPPPPK